MSSQRNPNLGLEDPPFETWYKSVLLAAIAACGMAVEGLDWTTYAVVPELVVSGKRLLLDRAAFVEFQNGRTVQDLLVRAGIVTPPAPAAPPAVPMVKQQRAKVPAAPKHRAPAAPKATKRHR